MGFAIFLTLIFVVFSIVGLFKGTVFRGKLDELKVISEAYLYKEMSDKEYEKSVFEKFMPIFVGSIFLFIIEMSLLLALINEEGLLYPTTAMLALAVVSISNSLFKKKASKQEPIEKWRQMAKGFIKLKYFTIKGTLSRLFSLSYYSYVLWLLLGL
jgi:hypothetical protein